MLPGFDIRGLNLEEVDKGYTHPVASAVMPEEYIANLRAQSTARKSFESEANFFEALRKAFKAPPWLPQNPSKEFEERLAGLAQEAFIRKKFPYIGANRKLVQQPKLPLGKPHAPGTSYLDYLGKSEIQVGAQGTFLKEGVELTRVKALKMALLIYMNPHAREHGVTITGTDAERKVLQTALLQVMALQPNDNPKIVIHNLITGPAPAAVPVQPDIPTHTQASTHTSADTIAMVQPVDYGPVKAEAATPSHAPAQNIVIQPTNPRPADKQETSLINGVAVTPEIMNEVNGGLTMGGIKDPSTDDKVGFIKDNLESLTATFPDHAQALRTIAAQEPAAPQNDINGSGANTHPDYIDAIADTLKNGHGNCSSISSNICKSDFSAQAKKSSIEPIGGDLTASLAAATQSLDQKANGKSVCGKTDPDFSVLAAYSSPPIHDGP